MTDLPDTGVERPYGEPPVLDAKPDYKVAFKRTLAKFSQDQCTDLAAALGGRDAGVVRGERWNVEELGDSLTTLAFDEQHPLPVGGQRQRERSGDGGLTGSALARDEVQACM